PREIGLIPSLLAASSGACPLRFSALIVTVPLCRRAIPWQSSCTFHVGRHASAQPHDVDIGALGHAVSNMCACARATRDLRTRSMARIDRRRSACMSTVSATLSPGAVTRTAAGAGFGQLRHHPRAWGQGGRGYAKRFAAGFGQRAVKGTIQFGVGTLRHEDPRSTKPLKPPGFRAKMKDALRKTFTVRRSGTTNGAWPRDAFREL